MKLKRAACELLAPLFNSNPSLTQAMPVLQTLESSKQTVRGFFLHESHFAVDVLCQDVENRSVRLPAGWIALHTGKAGWLHAAQHSERG